MPDSELTKKIKTHISKITHGAALVGIAPVDRFQGAPKGHHPGDFLANARSVVVVALPIVSGLMRWHEYLDKSDIIKDTDTYNDKPWSPRTVIRKHIERRCCYEVINDELQAVSMYGAIFLEQAGYSSTYLPTTYGQTLSWPGNYQWNFPKPPQGFAPFSHRHAAVAAGLGVFGLNNLLLTPQYGPRQRLVSIITEAPLKPNPLLKKSLCLGAKCALCVKKCPAHALAVPSNTETVYAKTDIDACRNYYKDSVLGTQCGRECMTACPVGRRKKKS